MIALLYSNAMLKLAPRRLPGAFHQAFYSSNYQGGCPPVQLQHNCEALQGLLEQWLVIGKQSFQAVAAKYQWLLMANFAGIAALVILKLTPAPPLASMILCVVIMVSTMIVLFGTLFALQRKVLDHIEQASPGKTLAIHMLALSAQVGIFQLGLATGLGFPVAIAMSVPVLLSLPIALVSYYVLFQNLLLDVADHPLDAAQMRDFMRATEPFYDDDKFAEILMMDLEGSIFTPAKLLGLQRHPAQ